jgi:Lar family restriction alleviation protein
MTNENYKLKPCPFCGSEHLNVTEQALYQYPLVTIECLDCETETTIREKNPERIIDKWNTRAEKETKMLIREEPKVGEVWQHFKGTNYTILNIAINTETEEKMVVYRNDYTPFEKVWARPMEMFMSEVDRRKYPYSNYKYRFTKLS